MYARLSQLLPHLRRSFVYPFVVFLALLSAGAVTAWTAPPAGTPPNNCTTGYPGCDAPLNVSATSQTKTGGTLTTFGLWANQALGVTGGATFGGNVGIGTASPGAKLHVDDPANPRILLTSAGNNQIMYSTDRSGVIGWSFGQDASDGNKFKIANAWNTLQGLTRFTIDNGGNVGIGTVTPKNQVTVNSSWGAYASPEAFSIRGTYPSFTLRSSNLSVGSGGGVWLNHYAGNGYLYWYNSQDGVDAQNWGAKMWLGPGGDLTTAGGITAAGATVCTATNGACSAAGSVAWAGITGKPYAFNQNTDVNQTVQFGRVYDDDANYYMDANSVSYFNDFRPNIIYDRQDTNYSLDLNNVSYLNEIRPNIIYDRQDTNYQVDPNGSTLLSYVEAKRGDEPAYNFHRPGSFATRIKLGWDNQLWFGGWSYGEGDASLVAGRFKDGNDQNWYVDPNGSTRLAGQVTIGATNPGVGWSKFEVIGAIRAGDIVAESGAGGVGAMKAQSFQYISDERLKKNIETLKDSLQKVEALRGVSFEWKDAEKGTGTQVGFVAQEIEKVVPELVKVGPDGYKAVDYGKMTALLVEAVKEQQEQIEELRAQIQELKAR